MKKIVMLLMAAAVAVSLAAGTSYADPGKGKGHAYGHAKKQWVPVQSERCQVVVEHHRNIVPVRPEVKVVLKTQVPQRYEDRRHEEYRHHEYERPMQRTHQPDRSGLVILANIPLIFQ